MRCKSMPQVNSALDLGWLRLGGVSADRCVVKVGDFQLFQVAQKEGTFVEIIGLRKGAVWDNQSDQFFSPTQHHAATGVMGTDVVGNSRSRCRIVNFLTARCSFTLVVVPQRDTKNSK